MTFLVGKADKNGKVKVTSVVPAFSKGMAKWAKQQLALFLAEQQAATQKVAKVKRKDAAITAVANKAKKNNSATETVGELLAA
jgi:dsDNA-binding SOS-regulon protein